MACSYKTSRSDAARRRRNPAGFLYIAVLFTSLLVMVAVSTALTISTSSLRSETDRRSREEALRLAESEIHRVVALIENDGSWRSTMQHDQFSDWHELTIDGEAMGVDASARHRFRDEDGSLDDDDYDAVELTVHARVDRSEAAVSVQLEPNPRPLDLLNYAITTLDDLQFEDDASVVTQWPVQVADDCKTNSSGLLTTPVLHCDGRVEMTLRGDLSADSIEAPTRDVLDRYTQLGTRISRGSIPGSLFTLYVQNRVFSSQENPFGDPDPRGIYWFDAGGANVVISHCHLRATLVIRNADRIDVRGGMVWHHPEGSALILAADSRIDFEGLEAILDESSPGESAQAINFNPRSVPYRGELFDSDTGDIYPTEFRGLIYSTHSIVFAPLRSGEMLRVTGAVIGRDVKCHCPVKIDPLPSVLLQPPPGLSDPTPMRFVRGTFRRVPTR